MPTLHWIGKDKVVGHHHEVPFKTLRREYVDAAPEGTPDNSTANRIIHGDNLEALKALLPEFEGRVKCIYIDPPYNTGNEGWVDNDNVNDPRILNLPIIRFWHKNSGNGGFRLNGFINHYPDFIIKTISGKIIILESKGDDRDNSDSVRKLKLGKAWAQHAGKDYRYFMVFENNPVADAYKLADALNLFEKL